MNNKRICPACGSENISENKKNITIKEPEKKILRSLKIHVMLANLQEIFSNRMKK